MAGQAKVLPTPQMGHAVYGNAQVDVQVYECNIGEQMKRPL